jgi:hypothetical protein
MKSAFLAAIFGITGGATILLAVPVEDKAPVVYSSPAKWAHEYGAPVVPQIEEEAKVPEPLDHYSAPAKTKSEKQVPPRGHRQGARPRPNFFERLVASFINLQKHQPAKSSHKQSRITSRRLAKNAVVQ